MKIPHLGYILNFVNILKELKKTKNIEPNLTQKLEWL